MKNIRGCNIGKVKVYLQQHLPENEQDKSQGRSPRTSWWCYTGVWHASRQKSLCLLYQVTHSPAIPVIHHLFCLSHHEIHYFSNGRIYYCHDQEIKACSKTVLYAETMFLLICWLVCARKYEATNNKQILTYCNETWSAWSTSRSWCRSMNHILRVVRCEDHGLMWSNMFYHLYWQFLRGMFQTNVDFSPRLGTSIYTYKNTLLWYAFFLLQSLEIWPKFNTKCAE